MSNHTSDAEWAVYNAACDAYATACRERARCRPSDLEAADLACKVAVKRMHAAYPHRAERLVGREEK